jgi:hypothetical protein
MPWFPVFEAQYKRSCHQPPYEPTLIQLASALVYANTLMFGQVLEEPGWLERMMPEDLRALIYHHVNLYGTFELDMEKRLPIDINETLLHS